ncbi:unnamed protein product [Ixodes pacificus]
MLVLVKLPRGVPAFGLGGSFSCRALAQSLLPGCSEIIQHWSEYGKVNLKTAHFLEQCSSSLVLCSSRPVVCGGRGTRQQSAFVRQNTVICVKYRLPMSKNEETRPTESFYIIV